MKKKTIAVLHEIMTSNTMTKEEAADIIIALLKSKKHDEWECILFVPDNTEKCKHCGKEKHKHISL
jgi:hypothetical protein